MKSLTQFAIGSGVAMLLIAGPSVQPAQAQVGFSMNVGNAGYTSGFGQLQYGTSRYGSYYSPYGYRSYSPGISYRSASYGYPVYSGTRVAVAGYGVPGYGVSSYGVSTYGGGIYRRPTYYVAPRTSYYGFSRVRPSLAPPTFVRPRRRF